MASHHGSTPAAWTAVVVCLVGFLVGGVGLVMQSWVAFWVGAAFIVASVVVGKVMQAMGMGGR